jgi:hypothetical protein
MQLPIRSLSPPAQTFRSIDQNSIDMVLLRDSIQKNGLLVPITVASDTIVDGFRRWLACKGFGWTDIECHVVEGDPNELRIITQTRSVAFGRDEKRAFIGEFVARNPEATAASIAHTYQWTPIEVESLVGLEYLVPAWTTAYRSGRIGLKEVWHLSRIRDDQQLEILDEGSDEVFQQASAIHREVRSARRRSMVSRPRGKGYNALVRERDTPTDAGLELIKANATSALDGWVACLNWVLGTTE